MSATGRPPMQLAIAHHHDWRTRRAVAKLERQAGAAGDGPDGYQDVRAEVEIAAIQLGLKAHELDPRQLMYEGGRVQRGARKLDAADRLPAARAQLQEAEAALKAARAAQDQ